MCTQSILLLSAFALLTNNAGASITKVSNDNMLDVVYHFEHNPTISAVLNEPHRMPQGLQNVREKIKKRKKLLVDGFHDAMETSRKRKSGKIDERLKALLSKGTEGHNKLYTMKWTPDKIYSRFRLHEIKDKESDPMYDAYSKYFEQWVKWNQEGYKK